MHRWDKNKKHIQPNFSGRMCFFACYLGRKVFPYFFSASSTATATETVAPTMGLLPMPRKPIISTSNPPDGGFVPAAQGLLEKESRPFAKQEAHHLKAVCCAFLSWEYLITSTVHETRCFDLIIQLLSSLFHLYHLLTSFNHPPPRVSENKS